MSRILTAKESMLKFELPGGVQEEKEEIVSLSFAQFICTDDLEDITVRFKKRVAMLAMEREWQAAQFAYPPDENGDITITFPVSEQGRGLTTTPPAGFTPGSQTLKCSNLKS